MKYDKQAASHTPISILLNILHVSLKMLFTEREGKETNLYF